MADLTTPSIWAQQAPKRIWLHGIGAHAGETTWCNDPDPNGDEEERKHAVGYVREDIATPSTPAANWRENGEADPHGDRYDSPRAALCGGRMTDDELANAVYLDPSIMNLTAAKDRIRWLSRALAAALASQDTAS